MSYRITADELAELQRESSYRRQSPSSVSGKDRDVLVSDAMPRTCRNLRRWSEPVLRESPPPPTGIHRSLASGRRSLSELAEQSEAAVAGGHQTGEERRVSRSARHADENRKAVLRVRPEHCCLCFALAGSTFPEVEQRITGQRRSGCTRFVAQSGGDGFWVAELLAG